MGERKVKLWVNLEYDYKYAKWRKTHHSRLQQ
jgi:hypothetical protein